MKRIFISLITLAVITSCTNKEVKLPTLPFEGEQEIYNHSKVWVFMKVKNGDTIADVNRNSTISTTHWLYNIDRRLRLMTFIESLTFLQNKHKSSPHAKEEMGDYFSYSDTISNKLSFTPFHKTTFITDSILSKDYVREHAEDYKKYYNVNITVNTNNIWLNDTKLENEPLKDILMDFIEFSSEGLQTLIHLNFNNEIKYDTYLYYRTMMHSLSNEAILINNLEFVFDKNKVPDCGCE